jgi:spermidine synthase
MPVKATEPNLTAARMSTMPGAIEITAVPVCIGFTAVIAQIVFMRELVVVFCGNEVSLGVILATWLLWTALGGGILGRLRLRLSPRVLVGMLQLAVGFSFPATIVLVRAARIPYPVTPGELLGPGAMLLTSVVALAAFCTLSGWLFAAASRLYSHEYGASAAAASGTVYLLEAIGSFAGGLLASIILLRYCSPLQIADLVLAANVVCAVCVMVQRERRRLIMAAGAAAVFVGLLIRIVPWLENASQAQLWRGFHLVSSANSVYGRLDVVETPATRSTYENGLVAFHADDPAAAEEAVHFALLQHPQPKSLLLIGGGLNGSLGQALQHPSLTRIDYVELDPTITSLAERYFPDQSVPLRSPRVHVHNLDGRLFVKTTSARFDVIIVNLPEPQTAQLNRFYTREFFAEAAGKLNPGGLLSLQLRGSEDYISPELGDFLGCIDNTLRTVFADGAVIPGEMVHFTAANQPGMLTVNSETLLTRLRERRIETRYVREYYLPFRLAPDRMRDLERELQSRRATTVNTDLSPTAYYFAVTLWSTRFGGGYRQLFLWLAGVRFVHLLLVIAVPVLAIATGVRWLALGSGRDRATAGLCVGATGMALMALEVLLLLGFQAIYGYVYYQLAIVIGAFMAGMAAGSWLRLRGGISADHPQPRVHAWTLAGLQAAAAISPLLVYALLRTLITITSSAGLLLASEILFPVTAIAFGMLGGYQFQVASRIYFREVDEAPASLAALYAIDLVGAFVGAILVSAYLVPVFGMIKSAYLISAVAAGPVLAALPPAAAAVRPSR